MEKEIDVRRTGHAPKSKGMFDQFFDYPFGRTFGEVAPVSRQAMPSVQETDEGYLLTVDIPGIPENDIEVTVAGNLLSIRAERHEEEGKKGGTYRRQYRKFQETIALPTNVEADHIEARCEHGILEVSIPKAPQAKAKKIEVQSAKALKAKH